MPRYFILRRFFSISGIILGLIIFWNIYIYSKSLSPNGIQSFNEAVFSIREIPFLVVFEILFFLIPLAFHAVCGFIILSQGRGNVLQYGYWANVRYWLQRMSGLIALFFIIYHIYATRIVASEAITTLDYLWMAKIFESSLRVGIYVLGATSILFYFSNGLWSSLITWGITVSKQSQRASLRVCMILFGVLSLVSYLIIANFAYYYESAPGWLAVVLGFVKEYLFR